MFTHTHTHIKGESNISENVGVLAWNIVSTTRLRFRADSHYSSSFRSFHRSIFVPSEWSVFTRSVVFNHFPVQQVIGCLRLSPSNIQSHSFCKRQLTATALMLDVEEKNVGLSDKKKRVWVQKCFRSRKSEGGNLTVYKELLSWWRNEIFISISECPSTSSIICFRRLKKIWKRRILPSEKQYHRRRN